MIKEHWKLFLVAIIIYVISFIFIFGINPSSNQYQSSPRLIKLNVVDETTLKEVSVVKLENKNILFDNINNKEILYCDTENNSHELKEFYPVYLRDIGDYYVVVYSYNHNKNYQHQRFILEHENIHYYGKDYIAFINKTNGFIYRFFNINISLNPKTIDLKNIQQFNDIISIPILEDFGTKTIAIATYIINSNDIVNPVGAISVIYGYNTYFHNLKDRYVETYSLSNRNIILLVNSSNNIILRQIRCTFRYSDGKHTGHSINSNSSDYLNEEEYIKQGFFTEHNGDIYYVDNDLNIRKLIDLSKSIFVEAVIDLESWEEQITLIN